MNGNAFERPGAYEGPESLWTEPKGLQSFVSKRARKGINMNKPSLTSKSSVHNLCYPAQTSVLPHATESQEAGLPVQAAKSLHANAGSAA